MVQVEKAGTTLNEIADFVESLGFVVTRNPIFKENTIRPFRKGEIITKRFYLEDCYYSFLNVYYVGISCAVPLEFQIFLSAYFLKNHPNVRIFMYLIYPEPSNTLDLSYIKIETEYTRKDLADPYHSSFFTPDELYPRRSQIERDYLWNSKKRKTWDNSVSRLECKDRFIDNASKGQYREIVYNKPESVTVTDNQAEPSPEHNLNKSKSVTEEAKEESFIDDLASFPVLQQSRIKKLHRLVREDNFTEIINAATAIVQQQVQNKSDFNHKYRIGTYVEKMIRSVLSLELQKRISIANSNIFSTSDIQGGQDIVIYLDQSPFYFIEVKSRWNDHTSFSMSKMQLHRAVEQLDNYALCAVDISQFIGSGDRFALSTEELKPLTKFVTNIGSDIRPLVEYNLRAEDTPEEKIHLVDYKGIIPKSIVQAGMNFDMFVRSLVEKIEKRTNLQRDHCV